MCSATSSGVPTGWCFHGSAPPLPAGDRLLDPPRLGAGVADHDRAQADRALDLGRVPPDRLAVLEEDRLLALHVLEAAADVVRVSVLRHELEGDLLAAPADEQRQPVLDRRRVIAGGLGGVSRSGCCRTLAVEHPAHDRERFAQPSETLREAVTEPDPELLVFGLEPSSTDAEDRPTVRDVIERRRHLCGQRGLPERVRADHQPDTDALRGLGPGGQREPALEHRPLMAADDGIEVVPGPERV